MSKLDGIGTCILSPGMELLASWRTYLLSIRGDVTMGVGRTLVMMVNRYKLLHTHSWSEKWLSFSETSYRCKVLPITRSISRIRIFWNQNILSSPFLKFQQYSFWATFAQNTYSMTHLLLLFGSKYVIVSTKFKHFQSKQAIVQMFTISIKKISNFRPFFAPYLKNKA